MKKGSLKLFFLIGISFGLASFASKSELKIKHFAVKHCFDFRVTCDGNSGFVETVEAASWGEATKKIKARYPNCKATQIKQKDC